MSDFQEKCNMLMYFMTKECARQDFTEFLENCDMTFEEWEQFKLQLQSIGITKTYV